ncbi:MAG: hypothetical protein FWC44_03285 [Methanomassiliicoccaceae archaeon]|nr:hypothetical protein [Methanomassiliicoccaceae archaeon]
MSDEQKDVAENIEVGTDSEKKQCSKKENRSWSEVADKVVEKYDETLRLLSK